jgi:hypothetical protein
MTYKEIDKKLKKIKQELERIELKVKKEKDVLKKRKKKNTKIEDWYELRDRISAAWDKNISVEEEMKFQRGKS